MKKILILILIMALALPTMFSCSGESSENEYVLLSQTNLSMAVGDIYTLTTRVYSEKENAQIEWSISAGDAVSCDNGKITAIKEGTAVVRAKIKDSTAAATCRIHVSQGPANKICLVVGESVEPMKLFPSFASVATEQGVSVLSDNASVASYDEGILSASAVGSASLILSSNNGANMLSCLDISVVASEAEKVSFEEPSFVSSPITISYNTPEGKATAVEVYGFSYETQYDVEVYGETYIYTVFNVSYRKTADSAGDVAKNTVAFDIVVYDTANGYLETYSVVNDSLAVGEDGVFTKAVAAYLPYGVGIGAHSSRTFYIEAVQK